MNGTSCRASSPSFPSSTCRGTSPGTSKCLTRSSSKQSSKFSCAWHYLFQISCWDENPCENLLLKFNRIFRTRMMWFSMLMLDFVFRSRGCLMRALRQVCLSLDFVKQCGLETKFHGRNPNEASHYCGVCEVEVRHTSCGFPCKMFSFSVSVNTYWIFLF